MNTINKHDAIEKAKAIALRLAERAVTTCQPAEQYIPCGRCGMEWPGDQVAAGFQEAFASPQSEGCDNCFDHFEELEQEIASMKREAYSSWHEEPEEY